MLDAGPNRATAFHVVGGQFTTTWAEGSYLLRDAGADGTGGAQALALAPAQGGFVELTLTEPLGIPGQFDSPLYLNALKRIVAAGRKHKKGLGILASDVAWARQHKRLGFNLVATGPDHTMLMAGVRGVLSAIAE